MSIINNSNSSSHIRTATNKRKNPSTSSAANNPALSAITNMATNGLINQNASRRSVNANPSNTLVVEVAESAVDTSRINGTATGSLNQKKSEHVHQHKSYVYWNRRRWEFKLDIPIDKPNSQLTQAERDELNTAIEKARDIFLADLKQRDNKLGSTDFNFVFTENGYQAYVPGSTEGDWQDMELNDALDAGYISDFVKAEDGAAKELSEIIKTPVPNFGKHISKKIEESPVLSALCKSTQKKESATSISQKLPTIEHKNGSCFLATTIWYLLDDPKIKEALPAAIGRTNEKEKAALEALKECLDSAEKHRHVNQEQIHKLRTALHNLDPSIPLDQHEDAGKVINRLSNLIFDPSHRFLVSSSGDSVQTGVLSHFPTDPTKLMDAPEFIDVDLATPTTTISNGTEGSTVAKGTTPISSTITIPSAHLKGGNPQTYKLVKALIHHGDTTTVGHYTALVEGKSADGKSLYYALDDRKNQQIESINETEFLKKAETAVKLLYVKTAKQEAASTSTELTTPVPTTTPASSTPATSTPTHTPVATPPPTPTTEFTRLNNKVSLTTTIDPAPKQPDAELPYEFK